MSAPWRITRGDQMFTAKDIAELKLMAVGGKIEAGDLIQAPGRTDWLYAVEQPELKGLVKVGEVDESEFIASGGFNWLRILVILVGVAATGLGFYALYQAYVNRPDMAKTALFGDNENALQPLDALATMDTAVYAQPKMGAKVSDLPKDSRVSLVRRIDDFYEVKTEDGQNGFVSMASVIPGYMFDQEMTSKYDPLFNPTRYLQLTNYSWTPSGDEKEPETRTNLLFEMENPSDYPMADVTLKVVFLDGGGATIEEMEIPIPRLMPPGGQFFVSNIDIDIEWDENTAAEIKIVNAKALLPDESSKAKAEEEERLADFEQEVDNDGNPIGMVVEVVD